MRRLLRMAMLGLACLWGCARDSENVLGTLDEVFRGTARNIAEQGPNSDEQHGAAPTPQTSRLP
jgi:hypothetical protein